METYYTVYKVTNKVSGKFYIGTHKTTNLDDGYMGSGKYLKYSIQKHGLQNFDKEILFVYDNPDEMYAKEAEIVNEDFLAEENTYNLKVGGFGSWDYVNENHNNVANHRRTGNYGFSMTKPDTENVKFREKVSAGLKRFYDNGGTNPFEGKKHTEETKQKMRNSAKGKQLGSKNSQYGSMWITNGTENRKIPKDGNVPQGWKKGRFVK